MHLLARRLHLTIGALILVAVASAVVAVIATHEASPLRPVFAFGDSSTHYYVTTKSQWETANRAHTTAWVTGTLSLTLFVSPFITWVAARRRTKAPRNPA